MPLFEHGHPLRICLSTVEYPPQVGGVGRAAQRLVRHLSEAGCEVHVVTTVYENPAQDVPWSSREDGATIHRLPLLSGDVDAQKLPPEEYKTLLREGAQKLAQYVFELDARHRFELFHAYYLKMAYPLWLAARPPRRPLIVSLRGSDIMVDIENPTMRDVFTRILTDATWVTAVNPAFLRRLDDIVPRTGGTSVIGNAVDTAALPRWEPTAANAGVVGAVSKFRPVKNIPLLTEGYALVPADVRRRLLLVGYWAEYCDDERARADAIAARAGIHDEITVTGALPAADVPAQLLKMRVFALTSTFEGMSNALLEALAVGTPVVTTTIAGLEEHAVDGEHLLRVDAMDAPALARALDAVLRDEALARRLSRGARALVAHYSLAAERQRWFDLYGELLAARAQPAR